MTLSAQMSHAGLGSSPATCSGAMYSRVPISNPALVRAGNEQVPPPSRLDELGERLLAVNDDVYEQQSDQDGDQRVEGAASKRVAQPLTHQQPYIEEPVPQYRVGERRRHGQEHQRQQSHVPGLEDP